PPRSRSAPPAMDNDISLLLAWADHTKPGAFANLHAPRTSSSDRQNSDTRFRGAPRHANFVGYVRTPHAPAYIPPAFLRRNARRGNARDRGRERLFPPDLRSAITTAQLFG